MNKTTDLHAATRARLEAAGITGFRINTGLFPSSINQPDIEGLINSDRGVIAFAADVSRSGRNWTLVPRDTKLVKRARALANSDIKKVDVADLDALLAPLMSHGLLRTTYERCTGATEYRGPSGRVIAVSIGGHHFARRWTPLALYMQHVGRIKRHMPPATDSKAFDAAPISGPTIKDMIEAGWLEPVPTDGPRTLHGFIDRWTNK